jgi:hypothetical protein
MYSYQNKINKTESNEKNQKETPYPVTYTICLARILFGIPKRIQSWSKAYLGFILLVGSH